MARFQKPTHRQGYFLFTSVLHIHPIQETGHGFQRAAVVAVADEVGAAAHAFWGFGTLHDFGAATIGWRMLSLSD